MAKKVKEQSSLQLRITFLSFYSGDVYRGVETLVHELANKLTSLGHNVSVYQSGSGLPGSNYQTITVKAADIKNFTNKALSGLDTDIVLPMNGGWQSLLCKMWAVKNKSKIVISGQAGPGLNDRINLYTFPDAFIGMTDFQCSWAKRINPLVNVTKIPNGINPEVFQQASAKPKGK